MANSKYDGAGRTWVRASARSIVLRNRKRQARKRDALSLTGRLEGDSRFRSQNDSLRAKLLKSRREQPSTSF